MTRIAGSAALVTGAAQGIGAALAHELVARGCDVAMADRDEGRLRDVAAALTGASGRKVSLHVVDVADRGAVERLAAAATGEHPRLNILINNAGVALFGQFQELDLADIEWLMGINFWGVVYGTRALLPHLRLQGEAHIVNLSSIFGIIAPPGQTAYSAAKFAVRGFSESLRHELATTGSPVRLSVVHPGGIRTGIARSARVGANMKDNQRRAQSVDRFDKLAPTSAEAAARRIVEGIERNEPRILIGSDARRAELVQRIFPETYWPRIERAMQKTVARASRKGDA
jgi:short-subunit dehydrogenase